MNLKYSLDLQNLLKHPTLILENSYLSNTDDPGSIYHRGPWIRPPKMSHHIKDASPRSSPTSSGAYWASCST
jgi:hypothetical protein